MGDMRQQPDNFDQDTQTSDHNSTLRWTLVGLALTMLLPSLGTSIANVALPTLGQAFNTSFQNVQWVVLAYLLTTTALIVSVGRLSDLVGRRRLLLIGLSLFTLASVVCGIAPHFGLLVVGRALQGLGAAIMIALSMAYVGDIVPRAKTGSVMGLLGTMSAIGTAMGPALGGFLIAGFGWRSIFFINVPLSMITILLVRRFMVVDQPRPKDKRPHFDLIGTALLASALCCYALAMSVNTSRFDALNLALLVAALCIGGLFILVEAKVSAPLIRLQVFLDPLLSTGLAMNALVATVLMTTLVVGPFYLSIGLGLNEIHVGLVMSIGPIISALSGVPAGRLVDRFSASQILIVGILEMVAGIFALTFLPPILGVLGYLMALVILTPGYQFFLAANNTDVMIDVSDDQRGVISGMLNLSRNLGLISGASLMGAVFAFASQTSDISIASSSAVTVGMQITFLVGGGLILLALVLALFGRSLTRRHKTIDALPPLEPTS